MVRIPEFEWIDGDPPPKGKATGRKPAAESWSWQVLIGILSSQPGRWIRVRSDVVRHSSVAPKLRKYPNVEYTTRVDDGIYLRWVGETPGTDDG